MFEQTLQSPCIVSQITCMVEEVLNRTRLLFELTFADKTATAQKSDAGNTMPTHPVHIVSCGETAQPRGHPSRVGPCGEESTRPIARASNVQGRRRCRNNQSQHERAGKSTTRRRRANASCSKQDARQSPRASRSNCRNAKDDARSNGPNFVARALHSTLPQKSSSPNNPIIAPQKVHPKLSHHFPKKASSQTISIITPQKSIITPQKV